MARGRSYRRTLARSSWLAVGTAQNVHQFGDLAPLLGLIAACNRLMDAMRHVIAQYLLFKAAQRGPDRRNLRDDFDAVAIIVAGMARSHRELV